MVAHIYLMGASYNRPIEKEETIAHTPLCRPRPVMLLPFPTPSLVSLPEHIFPPCSPVAMFCSRRGYKKNDLD